MPLQFFRQPQPQPKLYMDMIEPSRSTDSTVDASSENKIIHNIVVRQDVQPRATSPSLSNPFRKTSPTPPDGSWRVKDAALSPIFREERVTVDDSLESMWTIQRCSAFDEDDESSDDEER